MRKNESSNYNNSNLFIKNLTIIFKNTDIIIEFFVKKFHKKKLIFVVNILNILNIDKLNLILIYKLLGYFPIIIKTLIEIKFFEIFLFIIGIFVLICIILIIFFIRKKYIKKQNS